MLKSSCCASCNRKSFASWEVAGLRRFVQHMKAQPAVRFVTAQDLPGLYENPAAKVVDRKQLAAHLKPPPDEYSKVENTVFFIFRKTVSHDLGCAGRVPVFPKVHSPGGGPQMVAATSRPALSI